MAALQAFGPANEFAPAPSLMGSIEAGSRLGTTLRGQDIAANEARDRLSLAYAQLQSQEDRASEQAQARLTLAHATMQARQQQQDLMMGYREQALRQQAARDQALSEARAASLAERQQSGAQMMDIRERRLQDLDLYRQSQEAEREKVAVDREKRLALQEAIAKVPRLSESDRALMGGDVADLKRVETELSKTEPSGWIRTALHGFTNPGAEKIADLKSEALKIRQKIASYEPKARNLALPSSEAAAPTAEGATPFKEGALIRSKKDGKLYRVKNGEPVPEE